MNTKAFSVHKDWIGQSMLSHEITIAVLTLEGFLTSVGLHVYFETTPVRKFPIAVHTLEGFLTSVRSHVHCETALSFIFLVTVIALERQKGTTVPLEGSQCRAYSAAAISYTEKGLRSDIFERVP